MGSGASKKIPLREDQKFYKADQENSRVENKPAEEKPFAKEPEPERSERPSSSKPDAAGKKEERPSSSKSNKSVKSNVNSTEDMAKPNKPASAKSRPESGKPVTTTPWIDKLKSVAEKVDIMWSQPRQERQKWKQLLDDASKLLEKPRQSLPKDIVASVINGDLGQIDIRSTRTKVIVFVSSTFTDTLPERNALMRDVYPYLRSMCRVLGLDFGTVDMRWGVREETTMEHGTGDMCLREIQRCKKESAGPAFLAILSHKYGFSPFPPDILKTEFDAMLKHLRQNGEDVSILEKCFTLDENAVPPMYNLIARNKYEGSWWDAFEEMQELLSKGSEILSEEDQEKYNISITESEVKNGVFLNDEKENQVTVVTRELQNIKNKHHWHRHVIDMKTKTDVDWTAIDKSEILKTKKLPPATDGLMTTFDYYDKREDELRDNVKEICDSICESMATSIMANYEKFLHVESDPLYREVCSHRQTVIDKCSLFLGREDLVGAIVNYMKLDSKGNRQIFVVHGKSGCGKTSLMAMAATKTRKLFPNAAVVVRLLGTTGDSGSARSVLSSLCHQLCRIYNKDESQIPAAYKELIPYFQQCLGYATPQQPLKIFLDSLDQLSNEDFGQNLKWLSLGQNLPENVNFVVSTLPVETLDVLDSFIEEKQNYLEVKTLNLSDGPLILDEMLAQQGRTVTPKQKQIVLDKFEQCPLPLYLRLAADIAVRWRSYDEVSPDDIAPDMVGLISTIYTRLQSRYGTKLVHHALAYITAAKYGLSVGELEDILSCDEEVLDETFEYFAPPIRRIPPLLWIRIRNELGMYLMEKGADGTDCYSWYHRQFWETAEKMFLNSSPGQEGVSFRTKAHQAIAEYFEGKYSEGKMYTPKVMSKSSTAKKPANTEPKMADRQIPKQPVVVSGNRQVGRQLNRRKLSELPYNLLKLEDWEKYESLVTTLEFVEAKFEAGQGYTCLSEFIDAQQGSLKPKIKAMSKIIGSGLSHFLRFPIGIYQLASQQARENPIYKQLDEQYRSMLPMELSIDTDPPKTEDPCEMTLLGHTQGLHSQEYSPDGRLIVSTGRDASFRLWDVYNGAELVCVTDLPAGDYPADTWATWRERMACFTADSKTIIIGSEDGTISFYDLTGAQIHKNIEKQHVEAITGMAISPDGTQLATASKDNTVRFWSTKDWSIEGCVGDEVSGGYGQWCFGVAYSPDGSRVCSAGYNGCGVRIIDAKNYSLIAANQGHTNLNLCCAWSPKGSPVVTAGDNSSISLWSADGNCQSLLRGHKGWIWCLCFTPDGSKLLSCSSDRTLGIWDMNSQTLLNQLGGHLHRVAWAGLNPTGDRMVTGSLDCAVKVWDFEAVVAGRIPPVKGLHYSILTVSPDGKVIASCTGWSRSCSFEHTSGGSSGSSEGHDGGIQDVAWTPDSGAFISFDMGHTGNYPPGAERNAEVKVCSVPDGSGNFSLNVDSPSAVGATDKYFVVGTYNMTVHLFERDNDDECLTWDWNKEGSEFKGTIDSISWSKAHSHLAVSGGKYLKIWDIRAPEKVDFVKELEEHEGLVNICCYSNSGNEFVSGCSTGGLYIWAPSDGYAKVRLIKDHVGMFRDIRFSPEGTYLATVTVEMCLRVWEVKNDYKCKCVYYGPVNKLGFKSEKEMITGEATGNRKLITF